MITNECHSFSNSIRHYIQRDIKLFQNLFDLHFLMTIESFLRDHQRTEIITYEYFNDWVHLQLPQETVPPNFDKICVSHPKQTRAKEAIVSYFYSKNPKNPTTPAIYQSSSIIFWSEFPIEQQEIQSNDIKDSISSAYKIRFPKLQTETFVNSFSDFYTHVFSNQYLKDQTKRLIIHFISDYSKTNQTSFYKEEQFSQLDSLIRETLPCSAHIIDCDYAGQIFIRYQEIMKYAYYEKETNFFAFFSCSLNQTLPKSAGLPDNLFSACLISPAKAALLWHSWHYFCFTQSTYSNYNPNSNVQQSQTSTTNQSSDNQPCLLLQSTLAPLTVPQINSAPKELLDDLMFALKRVVEAMLIDSPLFTQIFRSDDSIADLFTGYAVALRIFSFFNVTPLSIPSIPKSIIKHHLWSTIDLRLDAVLMTLNCTPKTEQNIQPSFKQQSTKITNASSLNKISLAPTQPISNCYNINSIPFAQQDLQTIKLLIESKSSLTTFAGYITFIPQCISDPSICSESIKTLSIFLENGLDYILMASKLPIFPALVHVAEKSNISFENLTNQFNSGEYLTICMSKLYNFYPNAKELMSSLCHMNFFNMNLRSDYPLGSLVLFSLIFRSDDMKWISTFLKTNWLSITECLMQSENDEVRLWTLLFVSTFASHITQEDQILQLLDAIMSAVDDDKPMIRVAFLYALQFIKSSQSSAVLSSKLDLSIKLVRDLNPAVRRELVSFLIPLLPSDLKKIEKTEPNTPTLISTSNSMSTSDFFESYDQTCPNNSNDRLNFYNTPLFAQSLPQKSGNHLETMVSHFDFLKNALTSSASNEAISSLNDNPVYAALTELGNDTYYNVYKTTYKYQESKTFLQFFERFLSNKITKNPQQLDAYPIKHIRNSTSSEIKFKQSEFKKAKLEFSMKSYQTTSNFHEHMIITSNFALSPSEEQILFGTQNGYIFSHTISMLQTPLQVQGMNQRTVCLEGPRTRSSINYLQSYQNGDFPILMVTDSTGNFYTFPMNPRVVDYPILTTFKIDLNPSTNSMSKSKNQTVVQEGQQLIKYKFDCSLNDGKIYFYAPDSPSHNSIFCDLNSEKILGKIQSINGNITSIKVHPTLTNSVLVCDDELYLYDCRSKLSEPVLSYQPTMNVVSNSTKQSTTQKVKIFDCGVFKREPYLIPLCSSLGSIIYSDIRMMNTMSNVSPSLLNRVNDSKYPIFDFNLYESQAMCFDVHEPTLSAAAGTNKGTNVCFYSPGKSFRFPQKAKLQKPVLCLKWIPRKFGLFYMDDSTDLFSLTDN